MRGGLDTCSSGTSDADWSVCIYCIGSLHVEDVANNVEEAECSAFTLDLQINFNLCCMCLRLYRFISALKSRSDRPTLAVFGNRCDNHHIVLGNREYP